MAWGHYHTWFKAARLNRTANFFIFMSNYISSPMSPLRTTHTAERERGGVEFCLYSESWMRVTETKAFTTETDLSTKKKNRSSRSVMQMHAAKALKIYVYIFFNELTLSYCIIALQLAVEYSIFFYTALCNTWFWWLWYFCIMTLKMNNFLRKLISYC